MSLTTIADVLNQRLRPRAVRGWAHILVAAVVVVSTCFLIDFTDDARWNDVGRSTIALMLAGALLGANALRLAWGESGRREPSTLALFGGVTGFFFGALAGTAAVVILNHGDSESGITVADLPNRLVEPIGGPVRVDSFVENFFVVVTLFGVTMAVVGAWLAFTVGRRRSPVSLLLREATPKES